MSRLLPVLVFLWLWTVLPPPGLSSPPPGLLSGYQRETGSWGTVYHKGWSREPQQQLAGEIGDALRRVETRIGRARGRPFTAILARDRAEFQRLYQDLTGRRSDGWIGGVAFPAEDLLLVRGDAFPVLLVPGDRPRAVLEHELAHLILHRRSGTVIPRWFDEGVAQWAARAFLGPEDEAFLSGLARIGALYPLENLDQQIPQSHDLATLSYQQSLLVVEWIVQAEGKSAIGAILDRLEAGDPFVEALRTATGRSLEEMEAGFRRWLKAKRSLWEAIWSTVNIWTVAALLAVAAIIRSILRRRRLLRRMEDMEDMERREDQQPGDPDCL